VILQSEEGDPILSAWQYGLGRTIAWNTDATNQWTANWASWDNYVQLWDNMINYVVSNTNVDGDSLEVVQEGNSAVITYTTDEYDQNTSVKAICTDTEGNTQEITLDPVAPGEYQASMSMEELGIYTISLQNYNGEEIQRSMITAAAMQYSPEYRFDLVSDGLDSFVAQVNGQYITYLDSVFDENMESVRARANLAIPLLLAALILFMLDVIARRMNLDYLEWIMVGIQRVRGRPRRETKQNSKSAKKAKEQDVKGHTQAKETVMQENDRTVAQKAEKAQQTVRKEQQTESAEQKVQQTVQKEQQTERAQQKIVQKKQKEKLKKKEKKNQSAETEQALDMEELLKKKEERKW
jgi:hypothetical protein